MQGMRSMTYEKLRFRTSTLNDKPARISKNSSLGTVSENLRLRVDGRLKGRKKIPVFQYIQIRVDGT